MFVAHSVCTVSVASVYAENITSPLPLALTAADSLFLWRASQIPRRHRFPASVISDRTQSQNAPGAIEMPAIPDHRSVGGEFGKGGRSLHRGSLHARSLRAAFIGTICGTVCTFAIAVTVSSCGTIDTTAPEEILQANSGQVLITSARTGNPDIYVMDVDGGEPRAVTRHAAIDQNADWSPDGLRLAFMSNRSGDYEVFVIAINSMGLRQLTSNASSNGFPRWSPDGAKLLFTSMRDGDLELYVMDADGSNQIRLTWNPGDDVAGTWSPDGSRIAFVSGRSGGAREIYVMGADGTNPVRLTRDGTDKGGRVAWSPDGAKLAFYAFRNGTADIYVLNTDGTELTALTNNPANDRWPVWSPDGTRIAFSSDRDGDDEIYLMNRDGTGLVRLTNSPGLDVLDAWRP